MMHKKSEDLWSSFYRKANDLSAMECPAFCQVQCSPSDVIGSNDYFKKCRLVLVSISKELIKYRIIQITDTPFDEMNPVFSPDGKYLAFTSKEDDVIEVGKIDF